jgi:hypothetical protein
MQLSIANVQEQVGYEHDPYQPKTSILSAKPYTNKTSIIRVERELNFIFDLKIKI